VEWLIVGLASGDEPDVRCFRIDDGVVTETGVEVVDA
jgi:hypothetical protein